MTVDVKAEIQKLLAICKDESHGIDSAEAKEILAELAKEKDPDKPILQVMKFSRADEKRLLSQISNAVKTLRLNNSAPESSEPQGKKEEKTADPEVKTPTVVKEDNAPETESDTPEKQLSDKQKQKLTVYALLASELGVDLSAVTGENFGKTLSYLEKEQFRHDLHEYVCGKVDDYSVIVADYIEADGIDDKYKAGHWKTTLNFLKDEFDVTKQEDGARADRERLVEIALQVYAAAVRKSPEERPDEAIVKKTQSFLRSVSKVSQKDVARILSKKGKLKEDKFLNNLLKMGKIYELQEFTEKLAQKHINSMLKTLGQEQQKIYLETLKKTGMEKFIPQSEEREGATMAEDTTEGKTFEPSTIQKKACEYAKIDWNEFKNNDEVMKAIEGAGLLISGANIIDLKMDSIVATVEPETEEQKKQAEEFKKNKEFTERDDGVDISDLPMKALDVGTLPDTNEPQSEPQPEPQNEEDKRWIAEKIAYYKGLSETNKIENYQQDATVTDGFAAEFNGGKIHYSSKTNVAVSQDAGYKVYDVMLKDPHNVGRPVNFSDNMTPEMAARLYAACKANGNPLGANAPEFTDEQLKNMLGEADYAVYKAQLAARETEHAEPEKKEPTAEEIKQAMKDQYKMSVMENDGTIKKTAEGYEKDENGSDEALQEYKEMSERAQTGKPMLFEQFKKSPEEFRKLMSEVIEEEKLGIKLEDVKIKIQERENTEKGNKTYAGFEDQRDKVRNVGLEIPNIGAIDLSRGSR